jgi:hypothetical protein
MKTELRLARHAADPETNVCEVWYAGKLAATIYGADGPGVRVISKYLLVTDYEPPTPADPLCVVNVQVIGP